MSTGVAHIHRNEFIPLAEALLNSSEPIASFDEYRNRELDTGTRYEINPLREVLIAAVGECLNHDEYRIGANAAVVLRQNPILCTRACELDTIISKLTEQLQERRIQPAKEAALALAFFLSTRPNDKKLPQWGGSDPMTGETIDKDLDQHQFVTAPVDPGYLHDVTPEIVEKAINALIQNLDRKEYKRSSEWAVAKECAKAIGAIGYQRPALVADAVPKVEALLGEQDERQAWLVYALTSIGYCRPDLIADDFADHLEEFVEEAGWRVEWQLHAASSVGHRKIGHAPIHLESAGSDPETDLSQIVGKLYMFMLGRYPSTYDEVTQAFVEIYRSRPDTLTDLLCDELDRVLQGDSRAFDFPDNFMLLLRELAGVDATGLQPLLERSEEFYQDHSKSHYWYENALELHRRIASEDEDLLSDDLGDIVRGFLEEEDRHSVQTHGRSFLQEIDQWDEDLFSTPEGSQQVVDIVVEWADSEEFDIESCVEEIEQEDRDSE